jgi:hypothetical protein
MVLDGQFAILISYLIFYFLMFVFHRSLSLFLFISRNSLFLPFFSNVDFVKDGSQPGFNVRGEPDILDLKSQGEWLTSFPLFCRSFAA